MIQFLHDIWISLGSPSYISAIDTTLLGLLIKKVMSTPSKNEIELMLQLLNYRISELQIELKEIKDRHPTSSL
jgi:hypothetical protein